MAVNCPTKLEKEKINEIEDHGEINLFDDVENGVLLRITGTINGHQVKILIDCGASRDFIAESCVQRLGLKMAKRDRAGTVRMVNGTESTCSHIIGRVKLIIHDYEDVHCLFVTKLKSTDVILGKLWLERFNPEICWRSNMVDFEHNGKIIRLKCWPRSEPSVKKETKKIFQEGQIISAKQLQSAIKDSEIYLVIPETDSNYNGDEIGATDGTDQENEKVEALLNRYMEVFPEELPPGLPPKRSVDHKIEIIPGSEPPL